MSNNGLDDLVEAFKLESLEALELAEDLFLEIEKNGGTSTHFDKIFRVFHSLKGGASMFEMLEIQNAFHALENKFTLFKSADRMPAEDLALFLKSIDYCRQLFEGVKKAAPIGLFGPGKDSAVEGSDEASPLSQQLKVNPEVSSQKLDAIKFTACLVDDEVELLELMQTLLEDVGFIVHTFSKPKEAVDQIVKIKPDVILCDMAMPEMTGLEFHKEIIKQNLNSPILFISGHLNKSLLIEIVNQGGDGVIEKPFDNDFVINMAKSSARKHKMSEMIDQTVNFLLYQYSDFDDYLRNSGKDDVRKVVESEMSSLIAQRKFLRDLKIEHNLKVIGKKY